MPQGSQALALLVTGDRAVFRNMRFLGNQDTLYAASKSCSAPEGPCKFLQVEKVKTAPAPVSEDAARRARGFHVWQRK